MIVHWMKTMLMVFVCQDFISFYKEKLEGISSWCPKILEELLMIFVIILFVIPSFYISQILEIWGSYSFYIALIFSLSFVPLIIKNIFENTRRGNPLDISLSLMGIITLPVTYICLIIYQNSHLLPRILDSHSRNDLVEEEINSYMISFSHILILLILQISTSVIQSMQFSHGSLWFLPSSLRKVKRRYVRILHEDYSLKERLSKNVPNCNWCSNSLSDESALYEDYEKLKLTKENKKVIDELERMKGAYITTWRRYNHRYHLDWFLFLINKDNKCVWGMPFDRDVLNFDD